MFISILWFLMIIKHYFSAQIETYVIVAPTKYTNKNISVIPKIVFCYVRETCILFQRENMSRFIYYSCLNWNENRIFSLFGFDERVVCKTIFIGSGGSDVLISAERNNFKNDFCSPLEFSLISILREKTIGVFVYSNGQWLKDIPPCGCVPRAISYLFRHYY